MIRKFRALRLVALLYKIAAWIVFVVGGLAALFVLIIGAIQGQAGTQSPLVASVPLLQYVSGPLSGFMIGVLILVYVLLQFVLLYAVSEVIYLGLAIEHNTRETAYYLRGENEIPPPPAPVSWETQGEPAADKA